MLIFGEYQRMLGENRRTSNVWISVFVHSRYMSLYAKYILGTSKFAESRNIGQYCSENQFLRFFVNLCRWIFGIYLFLENWRMCSSGFRESITRIGRKFLSRIYENCSENWRKYSKISSIGSGSEDEILERKSKGRPLLPLLRLWHGGWVTVRPVVVSLHQKWV